MFKRRFVQIYFVLVFLVALVVLIRAVYLTISTVAPDFSVMWNGARSLLKDRNPYTEPGLFTGIGYPPNSLLFYIPFALLPYNVAQGLFVPLSALIIFGITLFSFKVVDVRNPNLISLLLVFSLIIFSFPTRFTLGMGQNNLIVFLLLIVSYYLYKTKRKISSAVILGLAISLKTIFVFFLLFYLFKKEWKILMVSVVTIVSVVLLTTVFFGSDLYLFYIKQVVPPLLNFSGREIYYNQSFLGFVSRLTITPILRMTINNAFLLTDLFLVFYLTYCKNKNKKFDNLKFSLFIISILMIDTLSWQHHFVWLIFPFIVLSNHIIKLKRAYLWVLLGISYLLVAWNFKNPTLFSKFPFSLILSNVFYGTLILFGLNIYLLIKRNKILHA